MERDNSNQGAPGLIKPNKPGMPHELADEPEYLSLSEHTQPGCGNTGSSSSTAASHVVPATPRSVLGLPASATWGGSYLSTHHESSTIGAQPGAAVPVSSDPKPGSKRSHSVAFGPSEGEMKQE